MKKLLGTLCGLALGLSCLAGPKKIEHVDFTITIRNSDGVVLSYGVATLDGTAFNFSFGSPYNANSAGIYGPSAHGHVIFDNLGSSIFPPSGTVYLGGFELTPSQTAQLKAGLWHVFEKSADGKIVAAGEIKPAS